MRSFCGEIGAFYTLCVRYTFCAGGPSLGAKSGLADDFPLHFFTITPPRNGNVARGPRDFSESDFTSRRKIAATEEKPPAKFRRKKTVLGNDFPLLKLKMRIFVQESAAEVTCFLSTVKVNFRRFCFYRYCC